MKTLLLSSYFYPHRGGSEFFLENLYHRLHQQNGWQTDVICYNTEKVESYVADHFDGAFSIYRLPCWEILPSQFTLPDYRALRKLLRQLKKEGKEYDLIVSNTRFFDNSWWAYKVGKLFDAPTVLVDYCAYHPSHGNGLVAAFSALADNLAAAWIRKRFDLMIPTSIATRKFMRQKLRLPVSETVVYNGIDSEYFDVHRPLKRRIPESKWQPGLDDVVVSFVGRFIDSKHPEIVVETAIKMLTENPEKMRNWHFVLAGSGPKWEKVKKKVAAKRMGGRIHLLGRVSREGVAEVMWSSDILVHPSTHAEGMPTTLAEAGYCENIVIASDRGDSKNVVVNGETGLIIKKAEGKELEKALWWTLENWEEAKKMGRKLKKRVEEKFTLDKNVPIYRELVRKLTIKN